ncbi:hypothetical protein HOK51_08090 [Candidatus Woesearchaeota archaeon]|jgi:hypothetical protein|nr:hypothetical protein [Candidatus Woesearchaeota archaeon]MBT6519784.1 hypothetical protein [Candidatus Woesearchaeota archaeon]MBT7368163.1 hypothetical protein [Candidatus Woesearchaeota archaeon]
MVKLDRGLGFGLLFGLIGIIISAIIFVVVAVKTDTIFGIVAILCGAISGGAFGLGYKIGKGTFKKEACVKNFLLFATAFGLVGVLAAYLAPSIWFAMHGIPLSFYLSLIEFDFMDALFIAIGAYGGRWAGKKVANMIIVDLQTQHAVAQMRPIKQTEQTKSNVKKTTPVKKSSKIALIKK